MMTIIYRVIRWAPILPWMFIFYWWYIVAWLPSNEWLTVKKIFVADSIPEHPPTLSIDWEIHKEFTGKWQTSLKKAASAGANEVSGSFEVVCTAEGEYQFKPGFKVPSKIDLYWWLGHRNCPLDPGSYFVETSWVWDVWGVEKKVIIDSNVFQIKSKA